MAAQTPSRCPFCRATGVTVYEPLVIHGVSTDVPYCGACGRNLPKAFTPPKPKPTAAEDVR